MIDRAKILLVDDEINVLRALSRQLHKSFEVHTAAGGEEALSKLASDGPFTAIVSDMRMPGLSGIDLLHETHQLAPDTVRLLLTGFGDLEVAVAAVNEGAVFRFLSKPCPIDQLMAALTAAVEQHRLITAERELLEQTLRGAVEALVETLSMTQPLAFGRAMRWKRLVASLTPRLCPRSSWPVEVAAMVSQLGAAALPPAVLERVYRGDALSADEREMVERIPRVTDALIGRLPRLELVREILHDHLSPWTPESLDMSMGARILRVVVDYDAQVSRGKSAAEALQILRSRAETYDPLVLDTAEAAFAGPAQAELPPVRELRSDELRVGMVLHADVLASSGMLLVTRGHVVTLGLIERLRNFVRLGIREPILIIDQAGSCAP